MKDQFQRAIRQGAVWTLEEPLKQVLVDAYVAMGKANSFIEAELSQHPGMVAVGTVSAEAARSISEALPKVENAYNS